MKRALIILLIAVICYVGYLFIDKDSILSILPLYKKAKTQIEIQYLTIMAKRGNTKAQAELAQLYYDGNVITQDFKKALNLAMIAADKGNAKAQSIIGDCYRYGLSTTKNDSIAFNYFNLAAKQGCSEAQLQLGNFYSNSDSFQNFRKAFYWYSLAAAQHDVYAMYQLAQFYYLGLGVNKDKKEGYKLFMQISQNNNQHQVSSKYVILHQIGNCFAEGYWGEKKSYSEALKWYLMCAKQGDKYAQRDLGDLYYRGLGTERNYQQAEKWYRLAAAQGDAYAQKNLCIAYYEGNGVIIDYKEAYYWALLANACTTEKDFLVYKTYPYTTILDKIAEKLSPKQIHKIQLRANKWVKAINRKESHKLF